MCYPFLRIDIFSSFIRFDGPRLIIVCIGASFEKRLCMFPLSYKNDCRDCEESVQMRWIFIIKGFRVITTDFECHFRTSEAVDTFGMLGKIFDIMNFGKVPAKCVWPFLVRDR